MSFSTYPSYVRSEAAWIGDVPSHWNIVRVRRLFEIRKRIAGEEGYDVLSITQRGIKIRDTESNDGQLSMDYGKYQFVYPGDFAMNHMDLLTGYIDISKYFGVTSPDYRVFSLRDKISICPAYFLYVFQMCYQKKIFFPFGQGSSQLGRWRLPTDEFNNFVLPCPSHSEQDAIATFLDRETGKIDALVEEQRRLIELLKEKRQAVISHAVTKGLDPIAPMKDSGVEWLGELPAHWDVVATKHLIVVATSGPRGWSELVNEDGSIFFQSQNIGRMMEIVLADANRIDPPADADSDRAKLQKDDVVVCITGGRTGAVAHVRGLDEPAYVNQHVCMLRPCEQALLGRFLAYALSSREGQEQLGAATYGLKQGLGLEQLRRHVLCLPSMREQVAIVAHLDKSVANFASLINETGVAITLLQERRAALISAAVTGKIDVRNFGDMISIA